MSQTASDHKSNNRRRRRNARARAGFSLLELVGVLLILGLLGAVAAFNVAGIGSQARIDSTKTSMQVIKNALNTYHLNEGRYPKDLRVLVDSGILEDKALRDAWKTDFFYRDSHPSPSRPFILMSYGPDRDGDALEDNIDIWTIDAEDE